ncbi:MAG: class IV adenylate cyclase [Clostridia bacterium]|nr:class IV adenylate cyclase [Clostridia bacterium]
MKEKEIELKFIINTDIKNKIIDKLNNIGVKTHEEHLIDTYYVPNYKSFEVDNQTMECVRIREQNNISILGYKKIHRECNPVYCDEYETEVESKDQTEKILFALGFSTQMIIDKTRVSYKYNNFIFDFDSVKSLGELMEVELIDNSSDVSKIYEFVSEFGLSKQDVTYEGIQMLMKKAMKDNK